MKAAIIDLNFHKKTKSFDFIRNILEKQIDLEYFYDSTLEWWRLDKSFLEKNFDSYIYLQVLPDYFDLFKIRDKQVIFIPMYDGLIMNKFLWKWFKSFNIKIICFSKKVYNFYHNLWFDCLYVQYFLEPLKYEVSYIDINIFFWYRWNIKFENLKKIIWNQKINLLTIKNVPDPGYEKLNISDEDIAKYNINFIDKFYKTHEEHYESLSKHNIFIAPRKQEWIWMSFLDSMSIWQCVIWYNDATLNEYITDWYNWYLTYFDKEISFDKIEKIWKTSKKDYNEKYNLYLNNRKKIINYILKKNNKIFKFNLLEYLKYKLISIRRSIIKLTRIIWNYL